MGGGYYLAGVVLLQIAVSAVSVFLLYRTIQILTDGEAKTVSLCVTLLYGCSPFVLGLNTLILTESLSLSFVVLFIYLMVRYIHAPSGKIGLAAVMVTFFATFIKPALIPFDFALAVFWVFRYFYSKRERRILRCLLAASLVSFAGLAAYSCIVYINHGIFNLTLQGPRHLLAACLEMGIYKDGTDPELANKMEQIFVENNYSIEYGTTGPIMSLFEYQYPVIQKFCIEKIMSHPGTYARYLADLFVENMNYSFTYWAGWSYKNYASRILAEIQKTLFSGLKMGHLYAAAVVGAVCACRSFKEKNAYFWANLGISSLLIFNLLFIFIGTYAEFIRSTSYLLPFVYVGGGMWAGRWLQGVRVSARAAQQKGGR